MSIGFSCYYGCRTRLEHKGQRTEVIYGFMNCLLDLYKRFRTTKIAFCFDSKMSFRKKKYPWYKKRTTVFKDSELEEQAIEAECLFSQFRLLKSYVLPTIGFTNVFQQRGVEADDLIASLVMNNPKPHTIVTKDEDMYQLLDYCDYYNHGKKEVVNRNSFKEKYRIDPKQWVEVKKLGGCLSDKIPGIPGVGEKTAISFILGELKPGKKLDGIHDDLAKEGPESIYERNGYLVTLPIPETKTVIVDFENEMLSKEGFQEVCDSFAFRLLDRSTRDDWFSLLKG